ETVRHVTVYTPSPSRPIDTRSWTGFPATASTGPVCTGPPETVSTRTVDRRGSGRSPNVIVIADGLLPRVAPADGSELRSRAWASTGPAATNVSAVRAKPMAPPRARRRTVGRTIGPTSDEPALSPAAPDALVRPAKSQ